MRRPIHMLKFLWKTRHWNRKHFPGCPVRYGAGAECLSPEFLCASREDRLRYVSRAAYDPAVLDVLAERRGGEGDE